MKRIFCKEIIYPQIPGMSPVEMWKEISHPFNYRG